jgi:large subunit ribosomal protein L24
MPKLHIKSGDEVKILAGKDKGKTGKVLQVFPRLGRVAVEGVNQMKRHLKPRAAGQAGQAVSFSMPIHASNVALVSEGGDKKKAAAPKKKA